MLLSEAMIRYIQDTNTVISWQLAWQLGNSQNLCAVSALARSGVVPSDGSLGPCS